MTKRSNESKRKPGKHEPRAKENKSLTAQTRKLLGKHYANKYRTGKR
jgi:hypothetical protein